MAMSRPAVAQEGEAPWEAEAEQARAWSFFAMPASSDISVTTDIWQMTFAASFHIDTL